MASTKRKVRGDPYISLWKLRSQVSLPHGPRKVGVFLLHFGMEYYYIAPFYRSSSCRQMRCIKCKKKGLKKYDVVKNGTEVMHRRCFCAYVKRVQECHFRARRIRQETHWEEIKDKGPQCLQLVAAEPGVLDKSLRKGEHDRRVWKERWAPFLRHENGQDFICCQESRKEGKPFDHPEYVSRYPRGDD